MAQILTVTVSDLKAHPTDIHEEAEHGAIVYVTYWKRPKFALVSVPDAQRLEALIGGTATTI